MRNLIIFLFIPLLFGCESKKTYDIEGDKAILDMSQRIASLQEDYNKIAEDMELVKKVLADPDIDSELRSSIRREVHEGEIYLKEIDQWISFLKIRQKQRYQSLLARKKNKNLQAEAEKEIKAYFIDKEIKPLARPWKDRYRTAIEL